MDKFAVLFGGNWDNTSNSGSRASNWNNSPTNSNNNIGARGVCEDKELASPSLCCRYGAAGSFTISVKNVSTGSLSEALVINFTILKGAVA